MYVVYCREGLHFLYFEHQLRMLGCASNLKVKPRFGVDGSTSECGIVDTLQDILSRETGTW